VVQLELVVLEVLAVQAVQVELVEIQTQPVRGKLVAADAVETVALAVLVESEVLGQVD
jgi:hypothetical protein